MDQNNQMVVEMETATKWDHHRHHPDPAAGIDPDGCKRELEKARAQISELQDERRAARKRLERFVAEEKAMRARAREELRLERKHRRQLEAANARLLRELGEARAAAKQQAQSYEAERKTREVMEEACSELTREVEGDQAEVQLLWRECLRMREDMEEERRMLQMAEVWREERVQMKLSDAKLALEHKYSQLNRLQAEMEAFLRVKEDARTRNLADPAGAAASTSELRPPRHDFTSQLQIARPADQVDVFEHFRRKESAAARARHSSPAPASSDASPATDLCLAKADGDGSSSASAELEYDGGRDSCSWAGTSGVMTTEARSSGASRRSNVNTALIRRLWRSAITESRKRTGGKGNGNAKGGAEQAVMDVATKREQQKKQKQSLKEKLMEARMDDGHHKPVKPKT